MKAMKTYQRMYRPEATQWLGDWHPLIRQIAPGEGITAPVSSSLPGGRQSVPPEDAVGLFLSEYKRSVLVPFELPAVKQACEHTVRNEMKELLVLDRSLGGAAWLKPYAEDSRTSGRLHLERLKPLRDQRGIRRYITAVDEGDGHGWHFLVAGVALGLYAVPLRQGLMDYALHTFWNVAGQAAAQGAMEEAAAGLLVNELASDLAVQIQGLFPASNVAALS
jgi:hypothetical protein